MIRTVCFLLLVLQGSFGEPQTRQHIINGSDTKLGDYPFMVGLRRYEEDVYCGGSLVSNRHVVTAAHCVAGYETSDITILVGTNDLLNGGEYFKVEKMAISHDYTAENPMGVAVVTLSKPVQFSKLVGKIDLAQINAPDNASATLTGFGYQTKDVVNGNMAQILQKLPVMIVNQSECTEKLSKYEKILPQHLCGFTAPLYGACYGDSGSPLVHENKLIGVAFSVYPNCAEGLPDVYARITYYLDFINQVVSN